MYFLPGNDLARALNWGGGYTGEKVMQLLLAIEDANTVSLDRYEGKLTIFLEFSEHIFNNESSCLYLLFGCMYVLGGPVVGR